MRVGLYAREWSMAMDEVRRGLLALDHEPVWRRHSVYRLGDIEPFDLVFTVGFDGPGRLVREDYSSRGVPVITMDTPWLGHAAGGPRPDPESDLWRLSLGDAAWLFPGPAPADRAEMLGAMPVFSRGRRGSSVLVCGQVVGDAAHTIESEQDLRTWAAEVLGRIRDQVDKPVVWRPHPAQRIVVDGYDDLSEGPLSEALRSAFAVVTISSGAGLEALQAGVPVVGLGPSPYSHLAAKIRNLPKLGPPDKGEVADLCARLAYQHWTRDDLADGSAVGLFLRLALGEDLWPEGRPAAPTTVEPSVETAEIESEPAPKRTRRRKKRAG